jgi:GDSL-like Lipase/Acylhydrolase family
MEPMRFAACLAIGGASWAAPVLLAGSLPALAPEPFAAEIRAFEEQDRSHPPEPGQALFLGSSSIRLWSLGECFPGIGALNRGFGGSQIADSVRCFGRIVVPCKPRLIVFYAGDNDIAAGKSPEQVRDDFQALVAEMRKALPDTRLLVLSIKPSLSRWHLVGNMRRANRLIRDVVARDPHLGYVDVHWPMVGDNARPRPELYQPDGLHLSPAGYRLWTDILTPHLAAP